MWVPRRQSSPEALALEKGAGPGAEGFACCPGFINGS